MDAKEFFYKYKKATDKERIKNGKRLFDYYLHNKEFTPIVIEIINEIIKEAGYIPQNEYFRIDAVGWISNYKKMKEAARKANIRINAHHWDLKIAVEHENDKYDWSDEVMKLIHIKCPLKVVIGYNYCNEREEEINKLNFIAEWMKRVEAFNKCTDEEYLVIIGNGSNSETGLSDYDDFGYIGYLYNWNSKAFEKI